MLRCTAKQRLQIGASSETAERAVAACVAFRGRQEQDMMKRDGPPLKEDLRVHGILGEKDLQASKQSSSVEGEDVREAISDASAVILIASASTRRSRRVKEALSIAQMYQRRVYVFWMQGDHLVEVMPTGWSHLPC